MLPARRPPGPPFNPFGEFTQGDEGDDRFPARELGEQARRKTALEAEGRNIGVEHDGGHKLCQVGPACRVGVREELVQLLVSLKNVIAGEIVL